MTEPPDISSLAELLARARTDDPHPLQCIALIIGGERCSSTTVHPSGLCDLHLAKQARKILRGEKLRTVADRAEPNGDPKPRALAERQQEQLASAPRCEGQNLKGEPCRAPAMRGSRFCVRHAPDLDYYDRPEQVRRDQQAKRDLLRAIDVEIKRDPRKVFQVLFEGLEAVKWEKNPVTGSHEQVPDWTIRMRCFSELADRVYGKATTRVEHGGAGGGPITIAAIVADVSTFRQAVERGDLNSWYEDPDDPDIIDGEAAVTSLELGIGEPKAL